MRFKLRDKYWRFLVVPNLGPNKGICDSPSTPNKAIRIQAGLSGPDFLETAIHEFLHAADWDKSEEWVAEVAKDLKTFLLRKEVRERF